MAKDGKHVIHAGGVFPNPLLNAEGNAVAATLPGRVVVHAATGLAISAGTEAGIKYVANHNYLTPSGSGTLVDTAIPAGENMVAIQPLPGMFLNVRAIAGLTITKGAPVYVGAAGRITATGAEGAVPFAYAEESITTATVADDLVRVVFN